MSTGAFTRNRMRRWSLPLLAVGLLICGVVFLALLETHSDTVRESVTEDYCCFCPPSRVQWEFVIPAVTLIVMAGYGLAFSLARGLKYAIARKQSREFSSKAADALYHHRTYEVVALVAQYPKSPIASLVRASLRNHLLAPSSESQTIKLSMNEWQCALVLKTTEIKQGLWALAAIGRTAPLVGVLYASIRISQAFWQWQSSDYGMAIYASDIAYAAWGVSLSLIIAVPAIWMHKYFTAQAETFILEMDRLSLALLDQMVSASENRLQPTTRARYLTQELHPLPTHRLAD